jgi:DNA-nicking Smr family endonuclease
MKDAENDFENDSPVELPVDGILDLHTFKPGEVKELVPDYLALCREKNILDVRVIHGKGTGQLREIVHSILRKTEFVERFSLAMEDAGGWGATLVRLKPMEK